MFLIKEILFVRGFFGAVCTIGGLVLITLAFRRYFYGSYEPYWFLITGGAVAIALGILLVRSSPTTVTLVNRSLGVITIERSTFFERSTVQYGSDEIGIGFGVKSEVSFASMMKRHCIYLELGRDDRILLARGTDYELDEVSSAVDGANEYLRLSPIAIYDEVSETPAQ